ncbi:MAG: dihydrofolate reductase [Lachnospiraceae bacterium]|nr:dihydrofolate reductase [Lachnospiraceae bacterium]
MKVIVGVDRNWAIGNGGSLLVHIPDDMKHFRKETTGKVVVLGRKTLATFPNGAPLKNRTNIILTRDKDFHAEGAAVVHSVDELLEETGKYPSDDVYVIGGDSIYRQLLPYCDTAIITRTDKVFEADAYFPDLDKDPDWKMTSESEVYEYEDIKYTFQHWERV